jgi:hypothetical protein
MAVMPQQTIASNAKTWRIIFLVLLVVFGLLFLIFRSFSWGIIFWGPGALVLTGAVLNLFPQVSQLKVSGEGLEIKNLFLVKKVKWAQIKLVRIQTGLLPFFAKAILETETGNIQIWNTFTMSTPNMVALFNYYLSQQQLLKNF